MTIKINREAIAAGYERIRGLVRRTGVLDIEPEAIGGRGYSLTLKLEHLQHTGSFKPRGAFVHLLTRPVPESGVVAASGGNHGAAVAYAARVLDKRASIFVPEISSPAKVDLIRAQGADLVVGGASYADALAAAEAFAKDTGALQIHAYDQPETLIGQGTLGLELEMQAPGLQTILVAIGGGGLIGGVAAWTQGWVRLIGVEPAAAPTFSAALAAGEPVDVEVGGIAADSLGARRAGSLAFPLVQTFVEDVVTVDEAAIRAAQVALWRAARIVAEPGGATALAALLAGAYRPAEGERVGVIVCGANTDAVSFAR